MLNKEICKRCIDQYFSPIGSNWKSTDDERWDRGYVSCFKKVNTNEVPTFCRYFMEQTVLTQERPSC